jgi:O-antigen/teichoic acid export membrane protein
MIGPLLAVTAPTLTIVIAGQLLRHINVPILAAATDVTTVGYFTSAMFLATATEATFTALTLVYMPYASRLLVEGGREELAAIQSAIGRWTYLLSLIPISVLAAFAEPIIGLLFGTDFLPAALPLRIVLIGMLIRAVVGPRTSVLLVIGRGRDVSISFAMALGVAVAVAVTLTPTIGLAGSAIAFSFGLVVRSVLSEVQLRTALPGSGMQRREFAAAATIALFAIPLVAPESPLTWVGPLAAAIATCAVVISTRDATDDELLRVMRSRLRRATRQKDTGTD